jgi:hypothetical protein
MLRFLDLQNRVIGAPAEWWPARVEVDTDESRWRDVAIWLQGQPLDVTLRRAEVEGDSRARVIADVPRLSPGRYVLRVALGDEWVWEEDVRVRPSKVGDAAFEHLINDLEARLPASIAVGLQRTGALAGVHLLPPAESTRAQELARLRRAVEGAYGRPGLASTLPLIGRDPHRMLRQSEPWVRTPQARRPVPTRLVSAVATAHNLDSHRRPLQVLDDRVEHTVDIYENRLVKLFANLVDRRLRRLTRASAADTVAADAEGLLARLHRARTQAPFLDRVTVPSHLPQTVTMALLKRPAYRAILEGYLELRNSPVVGIQEPDLEAPLENLPHLYQLWGTLEVCDALLHAAAALGYRTDSHNLLQRDREGFFVRVIPGGRPAVRLVHPRSGTAVSLVPERSFGRLWHLRSMSFVQRPDVTVEIVRRDGSRILYVFDPKYKLESEEADGEIRSSPVKSDVDKMHAYRDAIRDVEGNPVVYYAAILYPGATISYSCPRSPYPEIEAIRAYPGESLGLREHLTAVLMRALGAGLPGDGA